MSPGIYLGGSESARLILSFKVRMMTISIAEAILEGSLKLRKAGVAEARREAGSLVAQILGQDRSFILSHAEDALDPDQAMQFRAQVERRSKGEPLQYITGHQEFYGLDFEVSPDVLIPRPETELLVETALKSVNGLANPFICDVATGSGCVAIALLHELRKTPGAHGVAIDISPAALTVAIRNAVHHDVAARLDFVISDCFEALSPSDPDQSFDLVVSNPPYIAEPTLATLQREVRDFEPRAALAAGPDGLTIIRRLLIEAASFLKTGGHFIFEIGFDQSDAVTQMIDSTMWNLLEIHKDLQGIPRTVVLEKLG